MEEKDLDRLDLLDAGPVLEADMEAAAELPAEEVAEEEALKAAHDEENALDKNVRLLSPARMVARRFFRSKLSIVGLVILVALILFSWLGPVIYNRWGETEFDNSGCVDTITADVSANVGGEEVEFTQVVETAKGLNTFAPLSSDHILGTDNTGMDIFTRLMYGGRISLSISFLAVFAVTFLGVLFGGIAGYFGKRVDEVIMRICDILMCIPSLPIMLIIGTLFDSWQIDPQYRIYLLMIFLTLISWPGTARLVRGQILFLREQEYMVAAEAMGYSTSRKIFKHLVPNVLPQLIVSMTLSLGSMILTEATLSYLGLGVKAPYAAWGTMINAVSGDPNILAKYFNVWVPPGVCIVLAVLAFNFIGDGLRDALDPKARR